MGIEIVPLNAENLPSATDCVRLSFPYSFAQDDLPERSLKACLHPSFANDYEDMKDFSERLYWVGISNEKVVAVAGLMTSSHERDDTDWLNWFCVHPEARGHGYGAAMLEKAVSESIKRQKRYLRLWTTNGTHERPAQNLYEKMGFIIYAQEPYREGDATLKLFREKRLTL